MIGERRRGSLFVKVCGITNPRDACAAIEAGADALGFNLFRGSRRFVELREAEAWISELPPRVQKVAVVVDESVEAAKRIATRRSFDALQLHGSETPAYCEALKEAGVRFAKALPVGDGSSLTDLPCFFTRTVVLDSGSGSHFGGTGRAFPWRLGREFREAHPELDVIVAGGLTPENVAEAVRIVQPFGVDVTSGVEAAAGRKDHGLLRAFLDAARA